MGRRRNMSTQVDSQIFDGRRALVTGSSRGIGAESALILAKHGAKVAINYCSRKSRADNIVAKLEAEGAQAMSVGADLTHEDECAAMFDQIADQWRGLDILILNASGGMETDKGSEYAMTLNRDAQVFTLKKALNVLSKGSRVVFVTSHQAHFIRTTPTLAEYEMVALSKRAGEDELRKMIPELTERGIEFVVVSGDMIEGTITATLLNRLNPGVLEERKQQVEKLYNVSEFAAEIVQALIDPVPEDHTRLVGDVSGFNA